MLAKADATVLDGDRGWPLFTNRCYERGHAPGRRVVIIEIAIEIAIEIVAPLVIRSRFRCR
jgi:hypothetical protein